MEKLDLYNRIKDVPLEAQKSIAGGRLSGMTDINPMWRIKKLTEIFGACGVGWKTQNVTFDYYPIEIPPKTPEGTSNKEIICFCRLELLYKTESGEWSEPLQGFGGSMLAAMEKSGLHTNDECQKMAYTDAIGVAGKALGLGGAVYWQNDRTKYRAETYKCDCCKKKIVATERRDHTVWEAADIAIYALKRFGRILCPACISEALKDQSDPSNA